MSQRLLLIDGYSTIFRAFFALPQLSSSKGEPTNAAFGFAKMLTKLLREEQPDLVGIAFDVAGPSVRKESYAEYKANRAPMPDDLRSQIPHIRRLIEGFRIPILEAARYEADDVIGTVARNAAEAGYDVTIVTADKDLMQLVGDRVAIYHTLREKRFDRDGVVEYFGVPPEQVADVMALQGDSIDNVPGVPGIGKVGAQKLIAEHGSLEALLEHAAEIKNKRYREGLLEHAEQARLSKELATIHCDLEVPFEPEKLQRHEPDVRALYDLYRDLEFFSLLEEIGGAGAEERRDYGAAREVTSAEEWRATTGATTGATAGAIGARVGLALVGPQSDPVGVALTGDGQGSLWADCRREGLGDAVRETLRAWITDAERTLVGHDLKEVLRFAAGGSEGAAKLEVRARLIDTMLLAYLLRSALRSFTLEEVALERLHHQPRSLKDAGFGKEGPPLQGHPSLLELAAERALLPWALAEALEGELGPSPGGGADAGAPAQKEAGDAGRVYREIEEPLVPVLLRMEEAGIALDCELLRHMARDFRGRLGDLEREIYTIAGESFNLNSSQQLGAILFEKLGYPVLKRTRKTRSYSTSAETLEELAAQGFDLPVKLLEYRELSKLLSTYVEALPELVDAHGRVHTRYDQAVAATGRLSSSDPNLQNIPVRAGAGQEIRKAFRAAPGHLLLVADYSQIELRVLAHMAEDEALREVFAQGGDVHRSTAATVFGVAPELVSEDQRRVAKMINFGIAYGMSAFGLAQRLGIPGKDAAAFIEAYFQRFKGVRRYIDETAASAQQRGYVETLYGRTRYLADINSRNWNLRENAKRMAINAPIQGTAADLLKLAMIAVDRRLRNEWPATRLLLTVHDELVLETPAGDAERVGPALREEMEGVAELAVPLRVEVGVGETWFGTKA
ncbi:MAG TPA: DNA polymerase I [Thermoanaerobaculia bacterium]|nr:DNA polymerase I [Thermoanaerobaculia bacterium]